MTVLSGRVVLYDIERNSQKLSSFTFSRIKISYILINVLCTSPGCLVLSSGEPQWRVPGQFARLGVHRSDMARRCPLWPQLSHVSGEALHRAALRWPRRQNPSPVWDHRHRLLCKKNTKNTSTNGSQKQRPLWYLPFYNGRWSLIQILLAQTCRLALSDCIIYIIKIIII